MKRFKKYKLLLFEICETLGTICFMLAERGQNPYARKYRSIFREIEFIIFVLIAGSFLIVNFALGKSLSLDLKNIDKKRRKENDF